MDIDAKDCRLEGFRSGRGARYYRGIHIPTGVCVELAMGSPSKRLVMKELQRAVNAKEADTANSSLPKDTKP